MHKSGDLINRIKRDYGIKESISIDDLRFEKQLEFAKDPSRFKTALCGRRAGKTRELSYQFKERLDRTEDSTLLFVELTRPSAERKLWRPFKRMSERFGWGFKFHTKDLWVEGPKGTALYLAGADKQSEIEKIRGLERIDFAAIDECGVQKPSLLKYLIEEVIEPPLMDVSGSMVLSGTPGLALTGYWYDVTGRKPPLQGWSRHHWTVYDNPYINAEKEIAELLERRGWTVDNPIFIREYLGRWIFDSERRVYAFDPERNIFIERPDWKKQKWTVVLGMDFGTVASTAWAILAYPKYGHKVYVLRSDKKPYLSPSQVADITRDVVEKWKPQIIVGDLGGLGKAYADEMIKRYGIPIRAAKKEQKRAMVEYMSDALRTGHLVSDSMNKTLHEELSTIIWDDERKDIAEGQDDHEADAVRYAWAECPAYAQAIAPDIRERRGLPPWVDVDEPEKPEEKPYWADAEEF